MNSRSLAFDILKKVFINKAYSNVLLNKVSKLDIDQLEKDFVFNLVHGIISNKIHLDYLLTRLIDLKKTKKELQIILLIGLYQMIYLDNIPNYAIVNETVNLAKTINQKSANFINAILNKFLRFKNKYLEINLDNKDLELCIIHSFSYELYLMLIKQYDKQIVNKIVINNHQIPKLYIRVNTLKITTDQLFNQYKDIYLLEKTNTNDCLVANKTIINSDLYKNGLITIQDKASILVSQILNPSLNTKVLDMCSAPGGKLTHLSMIMNNTGSIIGNELSESKIRLIKENILRLNCLNISLTNMDARDIKQKQEFDYILLDAPCSGFGVFKRKPEIKLRFDQKQVKSIIQLQSELLESAYYNLKTNGEMVYSTCTINQNENQNQINNFLNKHKNMVKVFEQQIFGFEENTDGFYICKLKKQH
ncbi:16S rRNA (cytosine(967)-C(5))-methyltransferase RsmB [Mycoplasma feriruminatoris]|uniref:16S rRNA (cytosine(967)-C(5))-methyltransferase n=1 Tax=Mycoplasma feriruminatoris TaxID=1179777 RepID=A0AAQ3DN71_9MOLU|nr:16S rRNA (cytosine(967)-C(5))-methyltransferase RsmB [Mycoplasma feriruminatoris]WFQ94564.1 Ribosomal RNA small subunit methyltransferase B [Mycoplasma feriruminatoris]WFQ95388.1 Sun family protein [Mycoplasma feriruminatoris]WFQ96213.1 Sun family protein [Mycoplasma feriruminatoris]